MPRGWSSSPRRPRWVPVPRSPGRPYQERGPVTGFGTARRLASRAATAGARLVLPRRMRAVSDPMSGFFMIRRDRVEAIADKLSREGFKILLDIVASSLREHDPALNWLIKTLKRHFADL